MCRRGSGGSEPGEAAKSRRGPIRHQRDQGVCRQSHLLLRRPSIPSYNASPREAAMSFSLRPYRRVPLQCPDTYETDLFQRQGTVAWRIPRPCDPSAYRHGCDPPDSTQSVLWNRRFCQYVLPNCSPHITTSAWSRSYPIVGETPRKARRRCVNGSSICADEADIWLELHLSDGGI